MPRNLPEKPQETSAPAAQPAAQVEKPAVAEEEFLGMTAPTYGVAKRAKPPVVKVRRYRVEPGPEGGKWSVVVPGGKTFLAGGKIIDGRQYDIGRLRLQGVKLEDLGEEEINE